MTDEQPPEYQQVIPQPQYGIMPSQSLEITEHFTTAGIESFIHDELSHLIQSGYFPADMKNHFWAYINPDAVTSILSEKDIRSIMERYNADRKLYIKTTSKKDFELQGFEMIKRLNNLETLVETRLRKALKGILLERLTQQTQVSVMGQPNNQMMQPQQRGSWLSSIPKALGFTGKGY